jgi:hypothetical protein
MGREECTNDVDVLAIEEMRWTGNGIMDKENRILLYSGHQNKHEFGVGFLVNNRIKSSLLDLYPLTIRCAH